MSDKPLKYDAGKVRLDLLPPKAILELGKVLTFGANKYSPNGWRKATTADDLDSFKAALLRHVFAYLDGEESDPETGLPHLAHAMCNAAFLVELSAPKKTKQSQETNPASPSVCVVGTPGCRRTDPSNRHNWDQCCCVSGRVTTEPCVGDIEGNYKGCGAPKGTPHV